jgi:fructan beta-fructosidase
MFPKVSYAPRLTDKETLNIELVVDASSVELFADNGLTVMTSVFFPTETFTKLQIEGKSIISPENTIHLIPLKSIWK